MHKGFLLFTSSPTFVTFCLFDYSHSKRCDVTSNCGFDLHFPDDWYCLALFHVPFGHLHVFFEDYLVFLLLSYMSSSYILDIIPLSEK